MPTSSLDPQAFLDSLRVGGTYKDVFVIGSLDRRVTFLAQQTRAINLAVALDRVGRLTSRPPVVVIGGGIAGVTAAVALARKGANVTVLEKRHRPMDHQRACTERWVHPNIYDWPHTGWDEDDAKLPLLNWRAGKVEEVIKTIDQAWEEEKSRLGIIFEPNVNLPRLVPDSESWHVKWGKQNGATIARSSARAEIVVLAVGFGEEAELLPDARSYWKNDDLRAGAGRRTISLVSGTGDGGLTDTLRIALEDFDHSEVKRLGAHPALAKVRQEIIEIEKDEKKYSDGLRLTEAYLALPVPSEFDSELRVRPNTSVMLNSEHSDAFSRGSSALNRFLVSRLMKSCVDHVSGRIDTKKIERIAGPITKWRVAFQEPAPIPPQEFDRVVMRHGPAEPALASAIPAIWKALEHQAKHNREHPYASDTTRQAFWLESDFPTTKAPQTVSTSTSLTDTATQEAAALQGWFEVSREFLDKQAALVTRVEATDYFDGQDPSWAEAASSRIYVRQSVREISTRLLALRQTGHRWTVHRIMGPGGEGKTTIGMQVAASLVRQSTPFFRVFWRDQGKLDWRSIAPLLSRERPLVLVSDHAHLLRRSIDGFLQRAKLMTELERVPGSEIHLVLISREIDWSLAGEDSKGWERSAAVPKYPRIAGLTFEDARGFINAYREFNALGELEKEGSPDEQARRLVAASAARIEGGRETALLGGLIKARTGRAYESHVARILEAIRNAGAPAGTPLLDAYLYVAAAQAAGLEGLDFRVLAGALAIEPEQLQSRALGWLRSELDEYDHAGAVVIRTRHSAIARTALELAEEAVRQEPKQIYAKVVRAAVEIQDFHTVPTILSVAQISSRFLGLGQSTLAIATAEAAHETSPDNQHFLSKLAQVYRETGSPEKGAALIAAQAATIVEIGASTSDVRPSVSEWAVCCGEALTKLTDSAAQNAWLALYAMSDQLSPHAIRDKDLIHVSTAAQGLRMLDPKLRSLPIRQAIGACVFVGRQTSAHSLHIETHASSLSIELLSSIKAKDVPSHLAGAARVAWQRMLPSSRLKVFPKDGALTFTVLRKALLSRRAASKTKGSGGRLKKQGTKLATKKPSSSTASRARRPRSQ